MFSSKIIYTQAENDFKNRTMPSFSFEELKSFIEVSSLSCEDRQKVNHLASRLKIELISDDMIKWRKGYPVSEKALRVIEPYFNISKQYHVLIIAILVLGIVSDVFIIEPLANQQILENYKSAGIESLEGRYLKNSENLDVSAEIIDRFYRSRFFGGAYYKLTIEIKAPLEKTFKLEVDPELYQNKKIGENLLINVRYTKTIDKLKDIETITINDVSILE